MSFKLFLIFWEFLSGMYNKTQDVGSFCVGVTSFKKMYFFANIKATLT